MPTYRKVKLRTKNSGLVNDYTELQQKEIIFGNIEKSLFIREYSGNNLYQFAPLLDTTSVSTNRTWSSSYISSRLFLKANSSHTHNYFTDITGLPNKSIILSTTGLTPSPSDPCSEPVLETNSGYPIWSVLFTQNDKGFWNLPIPSDYRGTIARASLLYYGSASQTTWSLKSYVVSSNGLINSPTLTGTINFTATANAADRLCITDYTSSYAFFGSISNINMYSIIEIQKTNSGNAKLLQIKLEYI